MSGRQAATIALAVSALTACGHSATGGRPANTAELPASLNTLSASQVVDDFIKVGLPARNPREVTGQECPKVGCVQAISTDTVSVFKFPATGIGQRFTEGRPNVYQIEDLVLTFTPSVTDDVKRRYEQVVQRAAG